MRLGLLISNIAPQSEARLRLEPLLFLVPDAVSPRTAAGTKLNKKSTVIITVLVQKCFYAVLTKCTI
jgi:hypothetical protein